MTETDKLPDEPRSPTGQALSLTPYTQVPTEMWLPIDDTQEIKDFIQHLIDAMPGFVSIFSVSGPDEFRLVAINARALQNYVAMASQEKAFGQRIEEIIDPEPAAKSIEAFHYCICQRQMISFEQSFQVGSAYSWARSNYLPMYNCAGEITHIMTYWEDITERKIQELKDQEHQRQIIEQQAHQLEELSSPLLSISDSTMVMPLIGAIDTRRIQRIMSALLEGISNSHASNVIIDITGVPLVDTQVADSLLRASQAVRLLGASVILTGVRPEVAQTLVGLGVELNNIEVAGSLRDGIRMALKKDNLHSL